MIEMAASGVGQMYFVHVDCLYADLPVLWSYEHWMFLDLRKLVCCCEDNLWLCCLHLTLPWLRCQRAALVQPSRHCWSHSGLNAPRLGECSDCLLVLPNLEIRRWSLCALIACCLSGCFWRVVSWSEKRPCLLNDSINLDQCCGFSCDLERFEPWACSQPIVM